MGKKRRRRKDTGGVPRLQIKTTVNFGEQGIPLDQVGEVRKALEAQMQDLMSRVTRGDHEIDKASGPPPRE